MFHLRPRDGLVDGAHLVGEAQAVEDERAQPEGGPARQRPLPQRDGRAPARCIRSLLQRGRRPPPLGVTGEGALGLLGVRPDQGP